MAAATANRNYEGRVYTGKSNLSYEMTASLHVYRGTLAMVDVTTGLIAAFAAYDANDRFVGVHLAEVHNLTTALAHLKGDRAVVASQGTVILDAAQVTSAWLGCAVAATDDHTVQLVTGSNEVYVGRVVRVISTTQVEVEIDTDQDSFLS